MYHNFEEDEGMHGQHEKVRQLGIVIYRESEPRLKARRD